MPLKSWYQGFGANAFGGVFSGQEIFISTLDDSNPDNPSPGTFRHAVEVVTGPRKIIFKNVSGYIDLNDNIKITDPFCIIDGSQALNGGIAFRKNRIIIRTHDVVLSYLKFMLGRDVTLSPHVGNNLFLSWVDSSVAPQNLVHDIMIDHCEFWWGQDTGMGCWDNTWSKTNPGSNGEPTINNVTVQWSIFAEPLHFSDHPDTLPPDGQSHGFNFLIGRGSKNVSSLYNLYCYGFDRNTQIQMGNVEMIGNWFVGCAPHITRMGQGNNSDGLHDCWLDFINNTETRLSNQGTTNAMVVVHPDIPTSRDFRLHVSGNEGALSGVDPWAIARQGFGTGQPVPTEFRRNAKILAPQFPVSILSPNTARSQILSHGGASLPGRTLACDALLTAIQNDQGGPINHPDESITGGYPDLSQFVAVPTFPPSPDPDPVDPDPEEPFIMVESTRDYFHNPQGDLVKTNLLVQAVYDNDGVFSLSETTPLPNYQNQSPVDLGVAGIDIQEQKFVNMDVNNQVITINQSGVYDIRFSVSVRTQSPQVNPVLVSQTIGPGSGTTEFMRDDFVIPGDPSNSINTVTSNDVVLENQTFNAGDTIDFRLGCSSADIFIIALLCVIEPA